ncbi:hypothetical protein J2848_001237 [Azospirillum lipoferum]|uniref:DUF3095 domain-containing protein n=1 Tax=Azospirillum lipoferum TaxID=193 RepID=A0A5A9GVG2_AZOLI|nr:MULTISPECIES: DUF3095 family protein [Azospirillum]KAA0598416.1 DUF3095 domain-containing protein [Azospirillum lipoferum]MCP1609590.1 hypothetical protein [Azospirillum lipoferum]MDW5535101.1 DUF3095 family protein [Azospirillum sp. NL1]
MPLLPVIRDFAAQASDPRCYAVLDGGWSLAVADVTGSTQLAGQGRHRDVNFVAAGVVAVLSDAVRVGQEPAACQFGGDGAIAAVPPGREDGARAALSALAHWSAEVMDVPLRVGLVPVQALLDQGLEVMAALHDVGNGNSFGLFLGAGVVAADAWVKEEARWRLPPREGPLPGLESVSCRWNPVPPRHGTVLCVIVDAVDSGPAGLLELARIQRAIETIVPTAGAAPLGVGERLEARWPPDWRALLMEARGGRDGAGLGMRIRRVGKALAGSGLLVLLLRLGLSLGSFDPQRYRRHMAERTDFRKSAGGPRLVLDVTEGEAEAIETLLAQAAQAGSIRYGTARADATTVTCLVGDVTADRHVHFVDGAGLGFWRASVMLKAMKSREKAGQATELETAVALP